MKYQLMFAEKQTGTFAFFVYGGCRQFDRNVIICVPPSHVAQPRDKRDRPCVFASMCGLCLVRQQLEGVNVSSPAGCTVCP